MRDGGCVLDVRRWQLPVCALHAHSRVTACCTPAPRTRAACKRRPALHTCTRKDARRGCISFLHDACVCIRSLHANGVIAACAFATGWCCRCGAYRAYRTGPGNAFCCTYVARRAQGVFATGCTTGRGNAFHCSAYTAGRASCAMAVGCKMRLKTY